MVSRAAAALFLVLAFATVAGAASSARNGDLLYLRSLGGNAPPWDRLFLAAPDGSNPRDVTPAGLLDVHGAVWSPDGRRIALSALPDGGTAPELYVVGADGTGLRRLTRNQLADRMPAWSPDGRSIAFASSRDGLQAIYSMRADGSRQRKLSDQNANCETPAWSPNGRWIVATCQLQWWKLIRMRPDGSGERRLLPGYPLTESAPSWTPDGRILFSRGSNRPSGRGIFVVGADGSGLRRLRASGGEPVSSPDGRLIAFTASPDGANQELWTMRRDGTGAKQITATNGVLEHGPDWQRR